MEELVKVNNGEITVVEEVVNQIVAFEKEKLKMDLIEKDLKEKLKEAMENNNVTKLEFGELKVSYRNASTRTTVDSKKLKEDLPDIYEEYSKTSNVSSSISISVE
jgi:predicted phage-related endonuclease